MWQSDFCFLAKFLSSRGRELYSNFILFFSQVLSTIWKQPYNWANPPTRMAHRNDTVYYFSRTFSEISVQPGRPWRTRNQPTDLNRVNFIMYTYNIIAIRRDRSTYRLHFFICTSVDLLFFRVFFRVRRRHWIVSDTNQRTEGIYIFFFYCLWFYEYKRLSKRC